MYDTPKTIFYFDKNFIWNKETGVTGGINKCQENVYHPTTMVFVKEPRTFFVMASALLILLLAHILQGLINTIIFLLSCFSTASIDKLTVFMHEEQCKRN